MLTKEDCSRISRNASELMDAAFGMDPHTIAFRSIWEELQDCFDAIAGQDDPEVLEELYRNTSCVTLYAVLVNYFDNSKEEN